MGRWEDTQKKFVNAAGEEEVSKAVIYLGQDVDLGGWVWLGDIDDVSSADQDDPENLAGAHEIRAFNKTPNIKADAWEREIMI